MLPFCICFFSHKEWRKEVKKLRRKRIRQKYAKQRDDLIAIEVKKMLKDPVYLLRLIEHRELELFQEEEEDIIRKEKFDLWMKNEAESQKRFAEVKQRAETIEKAKTAEKERIRKEFEAEKKKAEKNKQEERKRDDEELENYNLLLKKIEDYIFLNTPVPEELTVSANSNPSKPPCTYFGKTGTCKFGARCSKNHCRPGISRVCL